MFGAGRDVNVTFHGRALWPGGLLGLASYWACANWAIPFFLSTSIAFVSYVFIGADFLASIQQSNSTHVASHLPTLENRQPADSLSLLL